MPAVKATLAALATGVSISVAIAQPAGTGGAPPSAPAPDPNATLPGMQRFEIRQDTPAERDVFIQRRGQQMLQQQIEAVPPLPQQRIAPALPSQR